MDSTVMKKLENCEIPSMIPFSMHQSIAMRRTSNPIKPKTLKLEEHFRQQIRNKRNELKNMIATQYKVLLMI